MCQTNIHYFALPLVHRCQTNCHQFILPQVPDKWRKLVSGSSCTLMHWKADMELAFNMLMKYIDKELKPVAYNLSAFVHPKLFVDALMIQHARAQYLDVNDLSLHTKVLA